MSDHNEGGAPPLPAWCQLPAPLGACPTLSQITKTFKGETVLHDVTWDVKKGQKVGLIGVNGAGKTTQLQVR